MTCIEELDLSVRSYNCLKRAGISTVEELTGMTQEEIMHIRNLGSKSYEEISQKIKGWRLPQRVSKNAGVGNNETFMPGDSVVVHAEVLQIPHGGSRLYKLQGSDNITFYIKGKDIELECSGS